MPISSLDVRDSVKPYPPVTVTYAGSGTNSVINPALGTHFRLTGTGATPVSITAGVDGQVIVLEYTASGGAFTATLATGTAHTFDFGTDITGTTATASGTTDYIQAVYNASAQRWRVIGYVKGY